MMLSTVFITTENNGGNQTLTQGSSLAARLCGFTKPVEQPPVTPSHLQPTRFETLA